MPRESCLRKESLFSGLADTAERRAEDQSGQGSDAVHPLAQGIEPAADVLLASSAAIVDSAQSGLFFVFICAVL